jgi:hypothetical protein
MQKTGYAGHEWARLQFSSPSPAIDDPNYHLCTKPQGIAILEGILQKEITDWGYHLPRGYLREHEITTWQNRLFSALIVREDVRTMNPFSVDVLGTQQRDGTFTVGVASYEGSLFVHLQSRFKLLDATINPALEVVASVKPTLKDIVRRDDADWKF